MKVYLINKVTKDVISIQDNVKSFGINYIVFELNGNEGVSYCSEEEEYVDILEE